MVRGTTQRPLHWLTVHDVPTESIDAADMAIFRRVLDQVTELDAQHPDSVAVQRAVAQMFKHAKRNRRRERNQIRSDADRKVLAATATGSPDRIDDETAGLPLTGAPGTSAGTLIRPQNCYICKVEYTQVDAFHHQLCPECATVEPAQARAARRPHRSSGTTHRWSRQDRHVHRPDAVARRRRTDHHDPFPPRRRTTVRPPTRLRSVAAPPQRRRDRSA